NPTSANVPATSGTTGTGVTAGNGCNWTSTANANWISITMGANGSGNGAVAFNFQANPDPSPRTGTVTIGSQIFTLNQSPGSTTCNYSLSSTSGSISANGGVLNVTLTTGSTCNWSVFAPDPFVTVTSGLNGSGTTTISLNVVANPSATSRTSNITIGGQTYT